MDFSEINLFLILISGLRGKYFVWLIFFPLDPYPWIRICFADPDPGSPNVVDSTVYVLSNLMKYQVVFHFMRGHS